MINAGDFDNLLDKKFATNDAIFHLKCLCIFIAVFTISFIIVPIYEHGDQATYIWVYDTLPTLSYVESRWFYTKYLTSGELVHYFLVMIFSRVVEKVIFISIFNSILAYTAMVLFRKWGVSFTVSAITVLTNYYFYILYFPAERLKFGFLFLMLSLIFIHSRKKFIVFSILSITSHFQMLIQYTSILFEFSLSKLKLIFVEKKLSISLIMLILTFVFMLIQFQNIIFFKVNQYILASNGISEIYRGLIFFAGALVYSKNKKETIYLFVPLIIAAFLVGGGRVNMIMYFVFLYFVLPVNHGFNIIVLITTLYFGYKNFFFLQKVFLYGNGFY